MPNKKISQLDSAAALSSAELLPIIQSSTNKTGTVPVVGAKLNTVAGTVAAGLKSDTVSQVSAASLNSVAAGALMTQDLGLVKTGLHRSPGAVTAMFVYDTSKDSDGGAWTEKCQHTSWYNETLAGKWLGAQDSELYARNQNATLGSDLIINGSFNSTTLGWTFGGSWAVSNGVANVSATGASMNQTISTTAGKLYRIQFDFTAGVGGNIFVRFANTAQVSVTSTGTITLYLISSGGTDIAFYTNGSWIGTLDNISVKEVTAQTTVANDYFQLTTDGKFYTLNKNLLTATATLATQTQWLTAGTYTLSSTTASTGSVAITGAATATHTSPTATTFTVATSGNVVFTVTGSVLTAQCELGSVATTYQANARTTMYTETFRGNKAKFPKLSAIVAEAANVTIYDLTESGRPMWMRFYSSSATPSLLNWAKQGFNATVAGIAANNSVLSIISGSEASLILVKFANDDLRIGTSGTGLSLVNRKISNRLLAVPYTIPGDGYTINSTVYAVAMTVLPDAPIDPVTGLQVPTIALATNGRVSVIKHNGTVVNSASTSAFAAISLTSQLLSAGMTSSLNWYYAQNPGSLSSSFTFSTATGEFGRIVSSLLKAFSRSELVHANGSLITKRKNQESVASNSINATITNTYNTGHLVGDIRRVYLADNIAGSISSVGELIVNGTFDTDLSGWTKNDNNSWSFDAVNKRAVWPSAGSRDFIGQSIYLVAGYMYQFSISTNYIERVYLDDQYNGFLFGTYNGPIVFSVPTTKNYLLYFSGYGGNIWVDNVSVKIVAADRSYKAAGAVVYGTLTKSLSANANQLVGYSGFSTANYLREPYSADLDFGTGEWSAGAWVNIPATLPVSSFPIIGSELVVNGTFDTDVTGWNSNATITWLSGKMLVTGTGGIANGNQPITTVIGKSYRVTGTTAYVSGASLNSFLKKSDNPNIDVNASYCSEQLYGNKTMVFTATSTTSFIIFTNDNAYSSFTVDDVSIKEIGITTIADRSYSSGASIKIGVTGGGYITTTTNDGTTPRTVTTPAAYKTGTWLKADVTYKAGKLAILVNGIEVASTIGAPLLTLNNSNAVLTIGNSYTLDAPFPGSIALLKLSATVPTAEQSQWMYAQESQLFRDGAQSCLPSSSSVSDLTYDDATDTWTAVQSGCESTWQGLIRTSYSTPSAGTYDKTFATSGIKLLSRLTTTPGVDIQIPPIGINNENKNNRAVAALNKNVTNFDFYGTFTGTTSTTAAISTSITSVAALTYPGSIVGATISGTGIPAGTYIIGQSGTTLYMSAVATASGSITISILDFILPVGYTATSVFSAGSQKREGATKDFTRLYDGFKETIRFGTAPGAVAVRIKAALS